MIRNEATTKTLKSTWRCTWPDDRLQVERDSERSHVPLSFPPTRAFDEKQSASDRRALYTLQYQLPDCTPNKIIRLTGFVCSIDVCMDVCFANYNSLEQVITIWGDSVSSLPFLKRNLPFNPFFFILLSLFFRPLLTIYALPFLSRSCRVAGQHTHRCFDCATYR